MALKLRTLHDIAVENNFKTINELFAFIKNKRIKTTGTNRSGHNLPAKFIITGVHPNQQSSTPNKSSAVNWQINNVATWYNTAYLSELCLDVITLKELEDEIIVLDKRKDNLQKQLDTCQKLGLEEYDEKLITTIVTIDEIKKSKSKDKVAEAKEFLKTINEL